MLDGESSEEHRLSSRDGEDEGGKEWRREEALLPVTKREKRGDEREDGRNADV